MEKLNKNYVDYNNEKEEELNVEEFMNKNFKFLSPYFKNLFFDYFKKIILVRDEGKNKNATFIFDVKFDEKCSNPLNIAHGGALATLIENLSTASLFYLTEKLYNTIDISINYKIQVELNQTFKVYINCQKFGFATSFVEIQIKKGDGVCTQASIIKTKIDAKF
jgi:acyl-coenzyme A thioesterase PaaI-like protein